jgi:MYND finger
MAQGFTFSSTIAGSGDGDPQPQPPLWSGLETPGMIEARCSLLLPRDITHDARVTALPPQTVQVFQDKDSWNLAALSIKGSSETTTKKKTQSIVAEESLSTATTASFAVDFTGVTILQLEPTIIEANSVMPVTITIGGRVVMTPENYDDFRIMMRTKEQSDEMGIGGNGAFDWPDVNALLLCPCCGSTAPIPHRGDKQEHEYWLVFYPLLQIAVLNGSQMTLGTRTICRLVCLDCMDDMIEGLFLEVAPGRDRGSGLSFTLPVSNVLAEAGSASFLEDGPSRPETHPHVDDILDAWTLYNLWEHSGAWQALQNEYRTALSCSLCPTIATTTATENARPTSDSSSTDGNDTDGRVSLKHRLGMECGNPNCTKVHGQIYNNNHNGEQQPHDDGGAAVVGEVCRLYIKCLDCHSELYCSRACREEAKLSHRPTCLDRRRQREEKRDKKTRKVECLSCTRKFPYTKMKKCSSCRVATYCSVDCQRKDWAQHKFVCKK